MKSIALATCFLDNYGACLQALALQHEIESFGCKCSILAYIEPNGYICEDDIGILKKRVRNFIGKIVHFRARFGKTDYMKFHYSFYMFRKKYLKFDKIEGTRKTRFYKSFEDFSDAPFRFDAFVCGSDQIWNPTFYGKNNPVYFLRFAGDKKRIAYAPSIGLSQFPKSYCETFREYVSDFAYLSVREQTGADIIKDLCFRDAEVVLDPTLLAGADFWNSVTKSNIKIPYKEYILCYIFSNTDNCSEYLQDVQKKTGLPIIYLNVSNLDYSGLDAHCFKYADPIDFLYLVKNAKFVLTDSFHGTAFSILFNKDFYVFKRERNDEKLEMYSRIENILNLAGLKSRTLFLNEPFELKEKIDYIEANAELEIIRQRSKKFLQEALEG